MDSPKLSILISTVPNRRLMLSRLWDRLSEQAETRPVEILALMDNKTRTIGAKRQALLDIARGEYVSFVDDDDAVHCDYVIEILKALESTPSPDLVAFPIRVTIDEEQDGLVYPSVKYAPQNGESLEDYKPPITNRPPHELCVWRRQLAQLSAFPDVQTGEDFMWARPLWKYVKHEVFIPKVLYWWRHREALKESFA